MKKVKNNACTKSAIVHDGVMKLATLVLPLRVWLKTCTRNMRYSRDNILYTLKGIYIIYLYMHSLWGQQ
jgi:hypothetical protein